MAKRKARVVQSVELVRVQPAAPAAVDRLARLVSDFLAQYKPTTQQAYRGDLERFRRWSGAPSVQAATELLLSGGLGAANDVVLRYRAHLLETVTAKSCNRSVSAIKSVVKLARKLGLVVWTLEVSDLKTQQYRDTRGPGEDGYRLMVGELTGRADAGERVAVRDLAMVRLLFERGLRRGEAVGLDLAHVDLAAPSVSILGKGRDQREALTVNRATLDALTRWVAVRGSDPGPLFVRLDRGGSESERLTGAAVWKMVRKVGAAVGIKTRPHGLRHGGITAVLDRNGGNMRAGLAFSRHVRSDTLRLYDDNRADLGGQMAALLDGIA